MGRGSRFDRVAPPWTTVLTAAQHDLILFGLVVAALALLATLIHVRFTSQEAHGGFRVASLTANAVVAIAFVSYLAVIGAFLLGYREEAGLYHPTAAARFAWELRYMDWVITVPLLVTEIVAISSLSAPAAGRVRRVGMTSAALMVACGFLGAFIVFQGRDPTSYTLLGVAGSVFFAVLYALFTGTLLVSLPRMPEVARGPYRAAVILLLIVWLVYPIVYGYLGVVAGGIAAVAGQLAFSGADMIAKIGFGTFVHRTAVLRSRNEEALDPSAQRRPRAPIKDSIYVTDARRLDLDGD